MKVLQSLIVLLASLTLISASAVAQDTRISIGTGGTGGLFYVIGAGMADSLNRNMDNATARAEVTGASVENIRRVSQGQMEFGFSSSSTLYESTVGEGPFEGETLDMAAMAYLYPAVLQIATLDSTGITDLSELEGQRVSLGPPGSNAAVLSQRVLEAYGVFDSIRPQFLSYNEGASALMNGQLDATVVLAGAPTAALIDLDSQRNMRLLPVEESQVADMLDAYPFYQLYDVPAGTYSGQTEDVTVINDPATLFTSGSMDEELVYNIVKALFDNLDELGEVHTQAAAISLETATNTPIDLHPGARRYFEEMGY